MRVEDPYALLERAPKVIACGALAIVTEPATKENV